jgi:hypothetical protein
MMSCRAVRGELLQTIAHIGFLFSDLVRRRRLSFFSRSPDSTDFHARVLP